MRPEPRCLGSKGFTLLELVLVMVIMGLTISFAMPSLRSTLYADQVKDTARRLVGLVEEVGQRAVREQATYSLRYDSEAGAFVAAPESSSDESAERKALRLEVPEEVKVTGFASFHAGTRSAATASLLFSRRGYVDFTLIYLQESGGDEYTIMLSPFLGPSRVFEGHLELDDETLPVYVDAEA
jgi:prepilin-type N-terminal cleavage/methylation domain-containing protein